MSNKVEATFHPGRSAGPIWPTFKDVLAQSQLGNNLAKDALTMCQQSFADWLLASPAPEVLGYQALHSWQFGLSREDAVDACRKLNEQALRDDAPGRYRVVQLVGVRGDGE